MNLCESKTNIDEIEDFIKKNKNQIDINLANEENGMNALHIACFENNIEVVKLLIDNFKDQIDINEIEYSNGYNAFTYWAIEIILI